MASVTTPRRGIFDIGRVLVDEARTLVQQEIQLARAEVMSRIIRDVQAAVLIIVSAVVLLLALFLLAFLELVDLVSYLFGNHLWLGILGAWLIFTIVFGLAAFIGVRRLQNPKPDITIQTLKEDLQWAREQLKRARP